MTVRSASSASQGDARPRARVISTVHCSKPVRRDNAFTSDAARIENAHSFLRWSTLDWANSTNDCSAVRPSKELDDAFCRAKVMDSVPLRKSARAEFVSTSGVKRKLSAKPSWLPLK